MNEPKYIYLVEDSEGTAHAFTTKLGALKYCIQDYATNSLPCWQHEIDEIIEDFQMEEPVSQHYLEHMRRLMEILSTDLMNLVNRDFIEEYCWITKVELKDE